MSPSAIGMISAVLGAVGPQAEAVRVSVSGPHCLWTAHAYGPGRGKIPLLLEVEQAVACWVAGDLPGLDRCPQRDVNLATGRIAPVGRLVAAVR
ncbi:hypothetical protein [Kitasatospora sp. NE20-6]|uniref:hypothetical protein n=1 Tax=Kitasatospora sp. NE20-6 TaxID=2859066 RepID=UPI0038B24E3B